MKLIPVYCILFVAYSCMTPSTQYNFIDGSGNRYVISINTMQYIPVEPKNSSSGFYSGGKPQTIPLTSEQFNYIQNMFEKAFAEPGIHIKNRVMMSGVIERITPKGKDTIIIQPGSAELKAITLALAKLKE